MRFLAYAVALSSGACAIPEATRRPNVVVIVSDDAGYRDFGCYGSVDVPTPHLDALARDGVRFTAGYVSASVCCPSRAGLLTGRYQQRFGHEFNGPGKPEPGYTEADMGLAPEERTLGDALGVLGYRTACVGKWHMGTQPQFAPTARGFDEFFGILGGSRSYVPLDREPRGGRALRDGDHIVPEAEITYLTDTLTRAAVDFIDREHAAPFLLYLAYTAPHTPMHAKPDDLEAFAHIVDSRRRTYAAMTKALDDGVGAVRATLDAHGLTEDTLVVFVNDNGGATNNGSDNGPLRGMKGSKWEGGIRVPFVVSWPGGGVPGGATFDAPVISLDVLPTAVAAAGGEPRPSLDGVDLLPFLRGTVTDRPHDTLFWRRGVAAACRAGDWKLIRCDGNPDLLFDLRADPGETRDLAARHPERVARLRATLASWERELAPPRWREGARWERNQRRKHRMDVVGRRMERRFP